MTLNITNVGKFRLLRVKRNTGLKNLYQGNKDFELFFFFLCSAYHGHSMSVIDISPYKFKNPKGSGQADYIHVLDSPDSYKGKY